MTNLIPFDFNNHSVRTIYKNDIVWFIAKDVCLALEYSHAPHALRVLDDDESDVHKTHIRSDNGTTQVRTVKIINESGLYHLCLKSRKPEAKKFRKWVTSEVLPQIRKTGGYAGWREYILPDDTQTEKVLELVKSGNFKSVIKDGVRYFYPLSHEEGTHKTDTPRETRRLPAPSDAYLYATLDIMEDQIRNIRKRHGGIK